VLTRHVLRNALIPTIVVLGLNIGWLIGNTLVVEKIFAIQGVGALLIDSILSRDFPVVQGLALVIAALVIAVNLLTDVARSALDPRLRAS
jgi:peptide/nickel transport system permease protein